MATAGDQPQIGPYPTWTTMWLYSADKDAQDKAFGIADLSAAWPMHYREGDAKRYFDRAKTVSGLGHPVSITDRKTICLICGINYHYTLPFDRIVQVGTITEQAYGGWVPDAAHQPDMFSPQYTVTGDPFYLEEMQFWASYSAAYFNGAA